MTSTTSSTSSSVLVPPSLVRSVAAGFGLGLAWGSVARTWTRQLVAAPQSSWRATVAVVLAAGVAGALLGVAHAAGRRGAPPSWRALALPAVALFLGPGLAFLPAFVLGGWGMRRGVVGRSVTMGATAAAPLLLAQTLTEGEGEGLLVPADLVGLLVVLGGAGLLAVTSAWAGSVAFGPWGWCVRVDDVRFAEQTDGQQPHGPSDLRGRPRIPFAQRTGPPVDNRA